MGIFGSEFKNLNSLHPKRTKTICVASAMPDRPVLGGVYRGEGVDKASGLCEKRLWRYIGVQGSAKVSAVSQLQ